MALAAFSKDVIDAHFLPDLERSILILSDDPKLTVSVIQHLDPSLEVNSDQNISSFTIATQGKTINITSISGNPKALSSTIPMAITSGGPYTMVILLTSLLRPRHSIVAIKHWLKVLKTTFPRQDTDKQFPFSSSVHTTMIATDVTALTQRPEQDRLALLGMLRVLALGSDSALFTAGPAHLPAVVKHITTTLVARGDTSGLTGDRRSDLLPLHDRGREGLVALPRRQDSLQRIGSPGAGGARSIMEAYQSWEKAVGSMPSLPGLPFAADIIGEGMDEEVIVEAVLQMSK
eukprot:gnl/Dysnectes_brevis/7726_a13247_216.p1 GENE.gnl/Dysnectes_brevis/7726_a13247_216~~gnl/Dysnectes_brevis/7726_a13247_216.p1  ORF type:complete len:290 (+),score=53.73 gnl/Dysnectes_brevis/7726_a13247_216:36-905(+)